MHRATCRYLPKLPCLRQQQIEQAVVDLSLKNPELGADKIAAMVRRGGLRVANKRVRQIRLDECLTVPPPGKKVSRRGVSTGRLPQKASHRGHVWTWDFIHDVTVKGGSFRVLSVVDEYTRECLAIDVAG